MSPQMAQHLIKTTAPQVAVICRWALLVANLFDPTFLFCIELTQLI